jgi:hypothetical protein
MGSDSGILTLNAEHNYGQVIVDASDETIYDLMSMIPVDDKIHCEDVVKLFAAANNIARTSRRGAGNICVCAAGLLDEATVQRFTDQYPDRNRVVINNDIPDGEAWLYYIGTRRKLPAADQPFAYADGTLRVHSDWDLYCRRVVIR